VRPSRIRREPVRLSEEQIDPRKVRKALERSRDREMWGGVAGVLLFSAALAASAVGIAAVTFFKTDPRAEAEEARFGQCYSGGVNCVLDGGTIYVAREKVAIAGITAPAIQSAQCPEERSRGIDAAMRLADLLNSGKVTIGPTFRDELGRDVRKVSVDGKDVGDTLYDEDLAKRVDSSEKWCQAAG
jgi:endonuclease YncB( thermonuclease family)